MTALKEIEGIGDSYADKLKAVGVKSIEALLTKGSTPKGREDLAETSGISEKLILEWVNRADLMRVRGVGSEYADLLEAAGVDSCVELGRRSAANLHAAMAEVNAAKKLVRQLPSSAMVAGWVEHAKTLERAVSH